MNAVGIDDSKGKSTVAVVRPLGELVASPFEITHTDSELSKLAEMLKSLKGETKVVMECTGAYHLPVAFALRERRDCLSVRGKVFLPEFGRHFFH